MDRTAEKQVRTALGPTGSNPLRTEAANERRNDRCVRGGAVRPAVAEQAGLQDRGAMILANAPGVLHHSNAGPGSWRR